ncbi:undecaprenyl-phosphate galactosephosphotransferase [Clostridium sp. CAG:575]|nr:undecaprenyl-phosphate galactosephosphotransferase [Clostridium sp. CAG:575]
MKGLKNYSYSSEQAIEETIINNATTINNKKVKLYIEKAVKRVIDIIAGLVGTILLIPITIGIYIARKMLKEDDGPIFYDQLRIGKGGKYFKLYKYRSMVIGADDKLKDYLAENEEAREEYSKYKKLKKDPRITKLGNFLRKTSLDEFPQFINVLKGDMSLVGPRPYLPREKEDMSEYYKYIIQCKPGITGYWQIAGRSNVTFQDRLDLDIKYYETKSLKNDIKILLKTFIKVFVKEGAI